MFEKKFEGFLKEQIRGADGHRLEMLQRDLMGTKILFKQVLLPVFGSFDGLTLEHEMTSLSGVKIYADAYHPGLRTVFEEDYFVTHAERISRNRFTFERVRARSAAMLGFIYFPYSRDELEEKKDFCQRNLYELIGRVGKLEGTGLMQLPVYHREILRCAILREKPFRLEDASVWLQLKKETCSKVLRELEKREFLGMVGGGAVRCHEFAITEKGVSLFYK